MDKKLLLFCCVLALTFFTPCKKQEKEVQVGREVVLFKFEDIVITKKDLKTFLDRLPPLAKRKLYSNPAELTRGVAQLIQDLATVAYAKKKGYFDDPEIKLRYYRQVAQLIKPYIWNREIKPYLKVEFRELQEYYEKNKEKFKHPELRRVMKIEFSSYSEALKVKRKIKSIKDFIEEARQRHKDLSFDLGYVEKGKLPPEAEKIVWSLQKGEISDPVKMDGKYVLWAVLDVLEEGYWDFEKVIDDIFREVRKKKIAKKLREMTQNFLLESDWYINFEELEKMGIKLSKENLEDLISQNISF